MLAVKRLALLAALAALAACQTPQQMSQMPAGTITAAEERQFDHWLDGFRSEAARAGISSATLERAFTGIEPNPRVIELDQSQPEFVRPIWEYIARSASDKRIADGRARLTENRSLLAGVGERYGVPPTIIVAIWGIESNYGANVGSLDVFQSLATLGWSNPKRDRFAREEMMAALRLVDSGELQRERLIGSWAGAMGQTQFLPSSYIRAAVDYDGSGARDLWASLPDVFASTANLLESFGWQRGRPWGYEVRVPAGFDWEQTELDVRKPVAEWMQQGVRRADGSPLAGRNDLAERPAEEASIIAPAGHRGPAFLVFDNFRMILRYNNATAYALSVGHLADRIAGGKSIQAQWPVGDVPLSRAERIELQTLLNQRGCNAGDPDALIGPATRRAIRCFQRTIGSPADGYPTVALLEKLRSPPSS